MSNLESQIFTVPFRRDCNSLGGDAIVFIREDILSKLLSPEPELYLKVCYIEFKYRKKSGF